MNARPFPALERSVGEIGLGCWQLGAEWGPVDDAQADAVLDAALDAGLDFLDTADVYGAGRSEMRIAACLRRHSTRPTIATKLGRFPEPGWPKNFTPETIRAHTEASLRRLGVDCLDLTQLHCVPLEVLRDPAVFDTLRGLRREGKIRAFGASVESMEEATACLEHEDLASLQILFSVFRQHPRDVLFERAKQRGVALIVRLPLASGLLSGKFDAATRFPEDDHRNFNRDGAAFHVGETFAGLPFDTALELVEDLRPMVPAGMTMAAMALRWILDHEAVTTVIPGATKPDQVRQNAAASTLDRLPEALHETLREYHEHRVRPHVRGKL